jgi:AcrR family transcriptional regulator
MARLTKTDWVRKGIRMLNDEGYDAIKIEHLCNKFGVTKGSFYHHFDGIGDYEEHLLKYWETETLGRIKQVVDSGKTPKERLGMMIKEVFSVSGKTELSLRAWALHNRTVKKYLEKMDGERIGVTRQLYQEVGVAKEKAGELAEFAYTAWLGIQCFYLGASAQKEKSVRLINEFLGMPVKGL